MRIFSMALIAAFALTGCAGVLAGSARNASVSRLGCPSDEIVVSHLDYAASVMSWKAECHGNAILCSAVSNPNSPTQVDCHPAQGLRPGTRTDGDAVTVPNPD